MRNDAVEKVSIPRGAAVQLASQAELFAEIVNDAREQFVRNGARIRHTPIVDRRQSLSLSASTKELIHE